jgi:hypothetical protein
MIPAFVATKVMVGELEIFLAAASVVGQSWIIPWSAALLGVLPSILSECREQSKWV